MLLYFFHLIPFSTAFGIELWPSCLIFFFYLLCSSLLKYEVFVESLVHRRLVKGWKPQLSRHSLPAEGAVLSMIIIVMKDNICMCYFHVTAIEYRAGKTMQLLD